MKGSNIEYDLVPAFLFFIFYFWMHMWCSNQVLWVQFPLLHFVTLSDGGF